MYSFKKNLLFLTWGPLWSSVQNERGLTSWATLGQHKCLFPRSFPGSLREESDFQFLFRWLSEILPGIVVVETCHVSRWEETMICCTFPSVSGQIHCVLRSSGRILQHRLPGLHRYHLRHLQKGKAKIFHQDSLYLLKPLTCDSVPSRKWHCLHFHPEVFWNLGFSCWCKTIALCPKTKVHASVFFPLSSIVIDENILSISSHVLQVMCRYYWVFLFFFYQCFCYYDNAVTSLQDDK